METDFSHDAESDDRLRILFVVLAFAAGLFTPFSVNVVGVMPLGELVFAGALGVGAIWVALHRVWPSQFWRSPMFWTLLACQAVAFGGYVLADLYRGSSPNDMMRGWARMIFLAIDLFAVVLLLDPEQPDTSRQAFLGFQWGYVLGMAAHAAVGEVLFDDYWKFGYAIPVTVGAVLLAPRFGFWVTQATCAGLGVLHTAMDYRSMGAICLLLPAGMALQKFSRRSRLWILPICGALGLAALGWLYFHSSVESTNRGSRSDIERTAMLQAAWQGFQRSPLLGNGSWFSKSDVMEEFFAIRYERSMLSGVGTFAEDDETGGGIALHSQLLVGLAEGGIFGGCFFIAYGLLLVWSLLYCVLRQAWHRWSAIYLLTLIFSLWSVAMSPFSGMHRILIATAAGLCLMLWEEARRERCLAMEEPSRPTAWNGRGATEAPALSGALPHSVLPAK